ncbi:MAG: ATP-binding cassette domain-containing protein, partial [Bacillota bacterium]
MNNKFLDVRNLKKYFKSARGYVHAVDGVNFSIERGKTLGVVGESGCGKSTLGRCVIRLIEPSDGEVLFEGRDICKLNRRELKEMRKDIQIVFQDPYSSLNPRKTILDIISEPLKFNKMMPGA